MLLPGIILGVFALYWAFTNAICYWLLKEDSEASGNTLAEEFDSSFCEEGNLKKVLASIYYWPVLLKVKGA